MGFWIDPWQSFLVDRRPAVFVDNTASFSGDVDEFQPVAKAFAVPDHSLYLHLDRRIEKAYLQKHACAHRNGVRNIGAHAVVAQIVASTKGKTAASRSFHGNFEADVNFMPRPTPRRFYGTRLGHCCRNPSCLLPISIVGPEPRCGNGTVGCVLVTQFFMFLRRKLRPAQAQAPLASPPAPSALKGPSAVPPHPVFVPSA